MAAVSPKRSVVHETHVLVLRRSVVPRGTFSYFYLGQYSQGRESTYLFVVRISRVDPESGLKEWVVCVVGRLRLVVMDMGP